MALMTIPTPTAGPDRARSEMSSKQPSITPQPRALTTSTFALGPDTCGFAAQSTVTCGTGQECRNVGDYRGCCEIGADCSKTIYTKCRSFEDSKNPAQCGPNTLCCPSSKAYCVTYGFMMPDEPSETFTHVLCSESPSLGSLNFSPPSSETKDISDMRDDIIPSPPGGPSPGAVVGAVVGSIVFATIVIASVFLFIVHRRRRLEAKRADAALGLPKEEKTMHDKDFSSSGRIPSQSTINQQRPLPARPKISKKNKKKQSIMSTFRPPTASQIWPLGDNDNNNDIDAGDEDSSSVPYTLRNPHPTTITALDSDMVPSMTDLSRCSSLKTGNLPTVVQVSTPTPPATRLAPPPHLRKPTNINPHPHSHSNSHHQNHDHKHGHNHNHKHPWILGAGSPASKSGPTLLQSSSPRLSYIPPPAIDEAFGEEVEKGLDAVSCHGGDGDGSESGGNRSPSPMGPVIMTSQQQQSGEKSVTRRFSFVSALGVSRGIGGGGGGTGGGGGDTDHSPDDASTIGRITPTTIDLVESRRGSFGV